MKKTRRWCSGSIVDCGSAGLSSTLRRCGDDYIKENKDRFLCSYTWVEFCVERIIEEGIFRLIIPLSCSIDGGQCMDQFVKEKYNDYEFEGIIGKKLHAKVVGMNMILRENYRKERERRRRENESKK